MHMCSLMYKKIRQEGEIRHMFVWAEGFTLYKEPLGLDQTIPFVQLTQVAHQDIKGVTMPPLQQWLCCQINWRNGYIAKNHIMYICMFCVSVCLCQLPRGGLGLCLCLGAVAAAIPMYTTKGWGGGVVL